MKRKTILLFFPSVLICLTPLFALNQQEVEESINKSRKEWQGLQKVLVAKQKEYQLIETNRKMTEEWLNLFLNLGLENKRDQKTITQIELKKLDWEIWDLAWTKDTEKAKVVLESKKSKIQELSDQTKEIRDIKDSLNTNGNKDIVVDLKDLEKIENPKTPKLIQILKDKRDNKEIIEKMELLVPDSIHPLVLESEGKGSVLKLKRLEEKKFIQNSKLSSQLSGELQEIVKNRFIELSKQTANLQKEIQEIKQKMESIPIIN